MRLYWQTIILTAAEYNGDWNSVLRRFGTYWYRTNSLSLCLFMCRSHLLTTQRHVFRRSSLCIARLSCFGRSAWGTSSLSTAPTGWSESSSVRTLSAARWSASCNTRSPISMEPLPHLTTTTKMQSDQPVGPILQWLWLVLGPVLRLGLGLAGCKLVCNGT